MSFVVRLKVLVIMGIVKVEVMSLVCIFVRLKRFVML